MKNSIRLTLFILFLAVVRPSHSATLWVGDSPECSGSNVFETLDSALFVAALNSDGANEIRLTNTITYTGNGPGSYQLTDWTAGGFGSLTIVGGYSNCFAASPTVLTNIGDTGSPIFTIDTSVEAFSEITLRFLQLTGGRDRAIIARSGALVSLEYVQILGNNGGIAVEENAFVDIDADSSISLGGGGVTVNGFTGTVTHGGGIHCSGANASVRMAGDMHYNGALDNGGHIYVGDGCFVELLDGVRIRGSANPAAGEPPALNLDADNGGGIYVDAGGQLHAKGRANRVILHDFKADNGGALYINGGLAILENVHMDRNEAMRGAAISVNDGGQLFMDRTADCALSGLRCSELQNSRHHGTVLDVNDSFAQVQRTLIERSVRVPGSSVLARGMIQGNGSSSTVRLNRVGLIDNTAYAAIGTSGGTFQLSHLTIAGNDTDTASPFYSFVNRGISTTTFRLENSLVTDTGGRDWFSGSFSGKCNLVDNVDNRSIDPWPANSYSLGTPDLVNISANDPHQLPQSIGVDMCQQDTFAWSTDFDIDMHSAPVNEMTNQQGMPGESGGLFDAGFDEVYANVGEDEFTLTVLKQGSGNGTVVSVPSGIACGADCSEVYFTETIVTLNAVPENGSQFMGWLNCPLVNQQDQCLVSMSTNHTVRAEFSLENPPGDLLFRNGFE